MSLSANYPTVGPVLNMDFVNNQALDPRVTFTRASTATYYNYAGVLQTAPVDTPRFDYSPSTLIPQGLLIEESRTNLFLQSADFGTTWAPASSSVSTNVVAAPDATVTADKLIENSLNAEHYIRQNTTASAGATLAVSIFAKAAGRTSVRLRVLDSAAPANGFYGSVDTSTGIISSGKSGTGTITSASATALPNGWYRLVVVGIASATATTTINDVFLLEGNSASASVYTGDGTSGMYIWGAQLEAGAFPTSYIPTVAATVTRSADIASMTGTNFSSWYNAVEGTIFTSGVTPGSSTSTALLSINDNTNNNATQVYYSSSAQFQVRSGGAQQALLISASAASFRAAGVYKTNDFAASFNGGAAVTSSSGSVPTVTQMRLGAISSGSAYLNGYIQRISYYNYRVTNAQLQALTGS